MKSSTTAHTYEV